MALVCLCRGNFYWPPHTTILFCSIFLDKIVLDTLKSRYHRSAPLGMAQVPPAAFTQKELKLMGVLGKAFPPAIALLQDERLRLEELVTHRFGLKDINKALALLRNKEASRVIIYPDQ